MERRLELRYSTDLIKEPLIYEVGQKFEVVTNIRRANVDESIGWVVLGIEGPEDEIGKAIQFFRDRGVEVIPVTRDVIEP